MLYFIRFITFCLFFNTTLFADDFKDVRTFEASFTQTVINPSGNKVDYEGNIYIKEPNKIKWKYTTPIEKIVYIDKHSVTIIEPELEQAIITKIQEEINIFSLLKSAQKTSNNIYKSEFNNTIYTLIIENNKLKQIQYQDEIENNINITFTNIKQNHLMDINIFLFTIPIEYDIIKK